MNPSLEGYEKGYLTESGAVSVDTGIFTGRSPKDKYIVRDSLTQDTVWWSDSENARNDNHPISPEVWETLKSLVIKQLSNKRLYIVDAWCGANTDSRLAVRFVTEVAWQAHFIKNMFIAPSAEEIESFEPDFTVLNGAKCTNPYWEKQKLNSENFVAFNLTERIQLIGGTWYGGEMKKGLFSVMNYLLPLRDIASMHCSANVGDGGDVALFFGLSGTGWNGEGKRISLKNTRIIINEILEDKMSDVEFTTLPVFGLSVPTHVAGIPGTILDPMSSWHNDDAWLAKASELGQLFNKNFARFTDVEFGKALASVGPVTSI